MDFLEEIVETDFVERSMKLVSSLAVGVKIVIVMREDPSTSLSMFVQYIAERHENEIVFLTDDIFSQPYKWARKANLDEAKVLFAISDD